MMEMAKYGSVIEGAFADKAPHKVCAYIYDVANAFNHFYHETTKILSEENEEQKSWIQLLILCRDILEKCRCAGI